MWYLQTHIMDVCPCLGDRERCVQIRPLEEQIDVIWKLQMCCGQRDQHG